MLTKTPNLPDDVLALLGTVSREFRQFALLAHPHPVQLLAKKVAWRRLSSILDGRTSQQAPLAGLTTIQVKELIRLADAAAKGEQAHQGTFYPLLPGEVERLPDLLTVLRAAAEERSEFNKAQVAPPALRPSANATNGIPPVRPHLNINAEIARICVANSIPLRKGDAARIARNIGDERSIEAILATARGLRAAEEHRALVRRAVEDGVTAEGIPLHHAQDGVSEVASAWTQDSVPTPEVVADLLAPHLPRFRARHGLEIGTAAFLGRARREKLRYFSEHLSEADIIAALRTGDIDRAVGLLREQRDGKIRRAIGASQSPPQPQDLAEPEADAFRAVLERAKAADAQLLQSIRQLMPTIGSRLTTAAQTIAEAFRQSRDQARDFESAILEASKTLDASAAAAREIAREKAAERAVWERSLVGIADARIALAATASETARWITEGRIPVARRVEFRRWGRYLQTTLHDPAVLKELRSQVPAWREAHKEQVRLRRRSAAQAAAQTRRDGGAPERSRADASELRRRKLKLLLRAAHPTASPDRMGIAVPITFDVPRVGSIHRNLKVEICALWHHLASGQAALPDRKARKGVVEAIRAGIEQEVSEAHQRLQERAQTWLDRVTAVTASYAGSAGAEKFSLEVDAQIRREMSATLERDLIARTTIAIVDRFGSHLDRALGEAVNAYARLHGVGDLRERSGLSDYAALFPEARAIRRRLVLHLGPTNSGKTHAAMEALARSGSGSYLAPLRLMAIEGAERLTERGIPVDMITGEERILAEGAQHVSSTIEMADLSRRVEVAVIDEIQMISDRDRGWAWTQAVVGVPADTIIMTGSADALPYVTRIAQMTGDEIEVIAFERKGSLLPLKQAVSIRSVSPGDAVIAFSRSEVLRLRGQIAGRGRSVAAIYGALGPEVRRAEARRFRSGEADILIATDAIGMGLNLPIRRVLFSAISKFDGTSTRELTYSEIRQIGGRAGRFGLHEAGMVGVLGEVRPEPIAAALKSSPDMPSDNRLLVMPPWSAIAAVSERLMTHDLRRILTHVAEVLLRGDKSIRPANLNDACRIADTIAPSGLALRTRHQYLGCPVDMRDEGALASLSAWAKTHGGGGQVRAPKCPQRRTPDNDGALAVCETHVKALSAYLWLALRWPDHYSDLEVAAAERARLNALIEAALKLKSIGRSCRQCGGLIRKQHRFPICDGCFAERHVRHSRHDDYTSDNIDDD